MTEASIPNTNGLYRALWRWHFMAGLVFAPLLVFLAITGGIYLFAEPIESLLYRDLRHVEPAGEPLPVAVLIERVRRVHGDRPLRSYQPPPAPDRSAELALGGPAATLFVNPYDGAIIGELRQQDRLMETVRDLHEKLLAGRIGNWLVELAACWMIILVLSGLYLWWPRGARSVWGVLLPRLRQGGRTRWRDLHAVTAFWLSLALVFWGLTGLAWSDIWGAGVKSLATSAEMGYPRGMFPFEPDFNKPRSTPPTGEVVQGVPWAVSALPLPASGPARGAGLSPEAAMAVAARVGLKSGYRLHFPQGEQGVYTLSRLPDDPRQARTLHIDRYTGDVLADLGYGDYGAIARAISIGIAIHQGRFFGWPNLFLGVLVSLGVVVIALSGLVIWWQRRPAGSWGAPQLPGNFRFSVRFLCLVFLLGLLFPLYGLSLGAVLALDRGLAMASGRFGASASR